MRKTGIRIEDYDAPAGGWGSVQSLAKHSYRQGAVRRVPDMLDKHNKLGGYMCTSCAWAKPAVPHAAEFCENGAKATFWELTSKRTTPAFFAQHSVTELLAWSDYDLENQGRLTRPMRYNHASDRYEVVSWQDAFNDIGQRLRALPPESVVFYTSGRASLEASYMYQLFARLYGTNNLPDSSNMCHESTSVALPESIGVPVGTVRLDDFDETDCIVSFGQNVGTNSPRMLHQLQEARRRDVPIMVFNPLRETGWEEFVNPQDPVQMVSNNPTHLATQYCQLKAGGDIAALMGMCKALITWDDQAQEGGAPRVLDTRFIAEHTAGFESFAQQARKQSWEQIERESGLSRQEIESATRVYARSKAVIAVYGMGLTQHRRGVENVQMLVNLLLLRGNIGKPGAGICPVRGHSNVQGQRTVGIAEKVDLVPLDKLAELYHFEPPRKDGLNTVEACEQVLEGNVRAFIGLGGNFVRASPEHSLLENAWRRLQLGVHIATKLNRSHLLTNGATYLLPCLGRLEVDQQASGPQIVTMEDSTACIHASRGVAQPATSHLLSEPAIIAGLAKATLQPNPRVPWDTWVSDYSHIRDAIEATYPEDFKDFNARLDTPGGFGRVLPARERRWDTDTGKANFKQPGSLNATFDESQSPNVLRLMTIRSNDQFNTTCYGYDDRFRGIHGTRMVLLLNPSDIARMQLDDGVYVRVTTEADDDVNRSVGGLRVVEYDIPVGCCAGYYPELNVLLPLWHHAEGSKTPAAKAIPVRITKDESVR